MKTIKKKNIIKASKYISEWALDFRYQEMYSIADLFEKASYIINNSSKNKLNSSEINTLKKVYFDCKNDLSLGIEMIHLPSDIQLTINTIRNEKIFVSDLIRLMLGDGVLFE